MDSGAAEQRDCVTANQRLGEVMGVAMTLPESGNKRERVQRSRSAAQLLGGSAAPLIRRSAQASASRSAAPPFSRSAV